MTDKTPCLTPAGASAMQARVRVTVIVSDNGSGKTALLRAFACARARSLSDIYVHAAARVTPETVRTADWACGAVYFDDFGDSLDIRTIVTVCKLVSKYATYHDARAFIATHAPYVVDMFAVDGVCVVGRDADGVHGIQLVDLVRRTAPRLVYGFQAGEQWMNIDPQLPLIREHGKLWLTAEATCPAR